MKLSTKLGLLSLSSALLSSVIADEYSWETTLAYEKAEINNRDVEIFGGNARYYTRALSYDGELPKLETPEFGRYSHFDLSYTKIDREQYWYRDVDDSVVYGLSYMHRLENSRHAFGIDYERLDEDDSRNSSEIEFGSLSYGIYLTSNWIFEISAGLVESPREVVLNSPDGRALLYREFDGELYGLYTKYIWTLGEEQWLAVSLKGDVFESDTHNRLEIPDWDAELSVDYYLSEDISLGLSGYTTDENKFYDVAIEFTQFITDSASIGVGFERRFYDDNVWYNRKDDENTYRGSLSLRF